MCYINRYNKWLTLDEDTAAELLAIDDKKEIQDRFYKDLAFGTGGLRGIMGAGTNRVNTYTVRKATYGLANYLFHVFGTNSSVVIAYDSRKNSKRFANDTASVLCGCGIKTYLFKMVMPTPVLSFAVRYLECTAGVVITASHNPKEYNGYKVYDNYGCQLVPRYVEQLVKYIDAVKDLDSIPVMDLERAKQAGILEMIDEEVLEAFIKAVEIQSVYNGDLNVVYTPLHGTGSIPIRSILKRFNVTVVKEQEKPDGEFPTVISPNPEDREALSLALKYAKEIDADIVLGTDPDCDRVGVGVRHKGEYELLTGNQIGALLVDFVLRNKKLNNKSTLVKTIVTNELGANIAEKRGVHIVNTLTGFKYIGDWITESEKDGTWEFVIGYEESYGYLVGTHARDKDAIVSSMLICEMAAYYKDQGYTLIDVLEKLYVQYGYYLDALDSFIMQGIEGAQRINRIMTAFREKGNMVFPNVIDICDYSQGIDGLPKENVLKYILDEGSWVAIRPSGTEPKIKAYYSIRGKNKKEASKKLDTIKRSVRSIIEN